MSRLGGGMGWLGGGNPPQNLSMQIQQVLTNIQQLQSMLATVQSQAQQLSYTTDPFQRKQIGGLLIGEATGMMNIAQSLAAAMRSLGSAAQH